MPEQCSSEKSKELAAKLKEIVNSVLGTGDWERSVFLKTSAIKLKNILHSVDALLQTGDETSVSNNNETFIKKDVPLGYTRVFILLYHVDGSNLDDWYRSIKTLTEYSVTRPVYKDEEIIKKVINSKSPHISRHGYVVVDVKNTDFYDANQLVIEEENRNLFTLKEKAVKLENIIEFVHGNKNHYVICKDKLVLNKLQK